MNLINIEKLDSEHELSRLELEFKNQSEKLDALQHNKLTYINAKNNVENEIINKNNALRDLKRELDRINRDAEEFNVQMDAREKYIESLGDTPSKFLLDNAPKFDKINSDKNLSEMCNYLDKISTIEHEIKSLDDKMFQYDNALKRINEDMKIIRANITPQLYTDKKRDEIKNAYYRGRIQLNEMNKQLSMLHDNLKIRLDKARK